MSDKKTLFEEFFSINSHKTKSKWEFCEIFQTGSSRNSGTERLKNFQKQGDDWHSRADGENEPK